MLISMCFQFSMLNIYHPYGCHLKGRAIMRSASRYCPLAIRWWNTRCSNLLLLIGCCSTSGTYFQDQRTDTCLQILSLVGIDETLVNFIKQSTQQRGKGTDKERGPKSNPEAHKPKGGHKGRAKREDSSPSQKRTNPRGVTRGQRNKLCSRNLYAHRTLLGADEHIELSMWLIGRTLALR
jgi:hypothetical protein